MGAKSDCRKKKNQIKWNIKQIKHFGLKTVLIFLPELVRIFS